MIDYNKKNLLMYIDKGFEQSQNLVFNLSAEQKQVPYLPTINPPLWEMGHLSYFFEQKILKPIFQQNSLLKGAESLFDSIEIAHHDRWSLKLPEEKELFEYCQQVRSRLKKCIENTEDESLYHRAVLFALSHEQMHCEAFLYLYQTLGYENPYSLKDNLENQAMKINDNLATIPAGEYFLGTKDNGQFIFDNEKWGSLKQIDSFKISKTPITFLQFHDFVKDGGYENKNFWQGAGLLWLKKAERKHPLYWEKRSGEYYAKDFSQWKKVSELYEYPCLFINWYEAQAYCKWANKRLPTEWEWQLAASIEKPGKQASLQLGLGSSKVNLLGQKNSLAKAGDFSSSDSYFGCRQMLGNIWEWTDSTHFPLPGYLIDEIYSEYSVTSFGYHKVLKGGSWASGNHFISNNFRNFYLPHRSDVFAGFRTCENES